MPAVLGESLEDLGREWARLEPEGGVDLLASDQNRDTGGEANRHRMGNELDGRPETSHAQYHEDHAGHDCCDRQAIDAVLLDDAVDDDDERARRPADLHTRTTERGDEESSDDRGIESLLQRHA